MSFSSCSKRSFSSLFLRAFSSFSNSFFLFSAFFCNIFGSVSAQYASSIAFSFFSRSSCFFAFLRSLASSFL
jgi:hypothetical protein